MQSSSSRDAESLRFSFLFFRVHCDGWLTLEMSNARTGDSCGYGIDIGRAERVPHSKTRAEIEPITFVINPDLTVERKADYVDLAEAKQAARRLANDQTLIELISSVLKDGPKKRCDVVEGVRWISEDVSKPNHKPIENVLHRYCDQGSYRQLWTRERGSQNAWIYTLKHYGTGMW